MQLYGIILNRFAGLCATHIIVSREKSLHGPRARHRSSHRNARRKIPQVGVGPQTMHTHFLERPTNAMTSGMNTCTAKTVSSETAGAPAATGAAIAVSG